MNKMILIGCTVYTILILMIGYPSIRLPNGEVWVAGVIGLLVISILPWLIPFFKYLKQRR